jgi:hypothetical protein
MPFAAFSFAGVKFNPGFHWIKSIRLNQTGAGSASAPKY